MAEFEYEYAAGNPDSDEHSPLFHPRGKPPGLLGSLTTVKVSESGSRSESSSGESKPDDVHIEPVAGKPRMKRRPKQSPKQSRKTGGYARELDDLPATHVSPAIDLHVVTVTDEEAKSLVIPDDESQRLHQQSTRPSLGDTPKRRSAPARRKVGSKARRGAHESQALQSSQPADGPDGDAADSMLEKDSLAAEVRLRWTASQDDISPKPHLKPKSGQRSAAGLLGEIASPTTKDSFLTSDESDAQETNMEASSKVQNMQQKLMKYCRIRPLLEAELDADAWPITVAADPCTVKVLDVEGASFRFDAVLDPGSQDEVFDKCRDIVKGVVDGSNGSIFSYGQTGAGKSFTMHGLDEAKKLDYAPHLDGVMLRAVQEIFSHPNVKRGQTYHVKVSVVLLDYSETNHSIIIDLLDLSDNFHKVTGKIDVKGFSEHECPSQTELIEKLESAVKASISIASSSVFPKRTLVACVTIDSIVPDTSERVEGKLVMCDLAASDQPGRAGEAFRLPYYELIALRDVLEVVTGSADEIPYKNHLLTSLLQDVVGGEAKSALIVHCAPTLECRGETLRSLQYASSV